MADDDFLDELAEGETDAGIDELLAEIERMQAQNRKAEQPNRG